VSDFPVRQSRQSLTALGGGKAAKKKLEFDYAFALKCDLIE
jgi:hypothetical protein